MGGGQDAQCPCAGKWLEVPIRRDCFVVNLGDMFQLWSNGKFRSTLHRVVSSHPRRHIHVAPSCLLSPVELQRGRLEHTTLWSWPPSSAILPLTLQVTTKPTHRYSTPFFVHPSHDTIVSVHRHVSLHMPLARAAP